MLDVDILVAVVTFEALPLVSIDVEKERLVGQQTVEGNNLFGN
jgi:hypothetical protein